MTLRFISGDGGVANQSELRRDLVLALLKGAVTTCDAQRGGVVALVGATGSGKTMVARQFVRESDGQAVLYELSTEVPAGAATLPALRGTSVIDDCWKVGNLTAAVEQSVREARGVVVLICTDLDEANRLAGVHVACTVPVSHWSRAMSIGAKED